jgi:four helix bundle protein
MAIIRCIRDLKVYQKSREQAQRIFKLPQPFPREARFSLTAQLRRSSRAVKSMIAAAGGSRRDPASFVRKMPGALGEATETQSWLDDALDCRHIPAAQPREHDEGW